VSNVGLLVVNFGGPRNLEEVPSFLQSLLGDEELIRSRWFMPDWIRKPFFAHVAKKRTPFLLKEYTAIGGKSPIYEDTEAFAQKLGRKLSLPTLTFHRYLASTHKTFIQTLEQLPWKKILVFPLFPQFCYATTGSIAKWFMQSLSPSLVDRMLWVRSYANSPPYIDVCVRSLREWIQEKSLAEEALFLLFSAHGVPKAFVREGDPYQEECIASFKAICQAFPKARSLLAYQSKFGKGAWLEPSTVQICQTFASRVSTDKSALLVPLSFSSEHIETLFELEGYAALLRSLGYIAHRCPTIGCREDFVTAASNILQTAVFASTKSLIRCEQRH